MIALKPIPHPTIWGGYRLCRYFENCGERIGHMYSLYDNEVSNLILNGEYRGRTLSAWFSDHRERFGLARFERFPVVLAIVEAMDNLSIQVHPDDAAARQLEDVPWGKNESWYFLEAPRSGAIYAGCGVADKRQILPMLEQGKGGEIADLFPVREGDYVYVPAGTLHAMTAGSLVYEIEENSEFTYRLYDFDRTDPNGKKRELHLEKALAALKPENKLLSRRYEGQAIRERLYTTALIEDADKYRNCSDTLECVTYLTDDPPPLADGTGVGYGMTVILAPEDELPLGGNTAMLARIDVEALQ